MDNDGSQLSIEIHNRYKQVSCIFRRRQRTQTLQESDCLPFQDVGV
jgi:hypothetical protein